MKAIALQAPSQAAIVKIPEPKRSNGGVLLRAEMVGLCGTDLNRSHGRNPMVSFARVIGHEIAATVLEGTSGIAAGTTVTVSP